MARTMICDARNRPVFSRPRKDRSGETTPATRKAWLESQPSIVNSSVKEHSVVCKDCQNVIQLHPRLCFNIENWQTHIAKECPCLPGREGESEPARKRRRLAKGSEPVMRTQMTLRSRRQSDLREDRTEVEMNRRSEQENLNDDETDVEDVEELRKRPMALAQSAELAPTCSGDLRFRSPFFKVQGVCNSGGENYTSTSSSRFRFYEYDFTNGDSCEYSSLTSRFPLSNERSSL
ncbi:hypothetical protein DFH05DRAFT_202049 [Lentinula detonsa]|uniref:Uncharacterized protein n=1 Tax=Lentinula detonsa TaxID=2804962 RepID=A0A9W8TVI4_9AGAR|nr:hypothetical protein DFH05DRAFT_202049 [Lentinula detonsa]